MGITPEELTDAAEAHARAAFPGARVERVAPLQLRVELPDGWRVDTSLEATWLACRDAPPAAVTAAIEQWLETLRTVRSGAARTVESLRPVIRSRDAVAGMAQLGGDLHQRPLAGDLVVLLAFDQPTSLEYADEARIEELGLGGPEAELAALRNLERVEWRLEGSGDLRMVVADGTFESSLILLPSVRAALEAELGPRPLLAVPARDVLIAAKADDFATEVRLRELLSSTRETVQRPISDVVLRHTDGGWVVWDPPPIMTPSDASLTDAAVVEPVAIGSPGLLYGLTLGLVFGLSRWTEAYLDLGLPAGAFFAWELIHALCLVVWIAWLVEGRFDGRFDRSAARAQAGGLVALLFVEVVAATMIPLHWEELRSAWYIRAAQIALPGMLGWELRRRWDLLGASRRADALACAVLRGALPITSGRFSLTCPETPAHLLRDGRLRGTLRLLWWGPDGDALRTVVEAHVLIAEARHTGDVGRLEAFLRGWVEGLRHLLQAAGTIGDGELVPTRLVPHELLDDLNLNTIRAFRDATIQRGL